MSDNELSHDPSLSEVGYNRNAPCAASESEKLLLLLEQQNRNFLAMLEAVKQTRSPSELRLPDFNPDRHNVDARAWIATADTCTSDGCQHGAPLMIALSRAMKGDASTWLSTVSFPGMTWENFKELFTARYACPETVASYLINMAGSRPKENECLAAYGASLMTSIMSRWKNLTTEQIAVATVLAHISQFEPRIQRLSCTTDIDNRKRLQQELTAVSFLKRNAPLKSDALDFKRIRPATSHASIKCFLCGKLGHKSTQCFSRRNLKSNGDNNQTRFNNHKKPAAEHLSITCYSCQGQGHYASSCPKRRSKEGGNGNGGSSTTEKRVDLCNVNAPAGYLYHNDCLHLQLYRDPKDRYKKGQTKASLSLQHFLGFESGFTLDKESNTIAIICQDVIVVLAFETRERLIAWQVKVGSQLGASKEYLVIIGGGGSRKLPAGPARLHIQGKRFALTNGVPPRLLGLWELSHLRRYGVVEGRFCFEGGSHCGKGEGLHMLITDQAKDITDAFDQAGQGNLAQQRTKSSIGNDRGFKSRPNTRLSDFNTTDSMQDTASALYEDNYFGESCGKTSPFWPSDERREYEESEFRPEHEIKVPWTEADHVTLERCNNCLTKLGALSRSSTVAITPGTYFNPAWTMEAVSEIKSDDSTDSSDYLSKDIKTHSDICRCNELPPNRPPKPAHFEPKKPPAALPVVNCSCNFNEPSNNNPKVGPYENYDVPKTPHTEFNTSEYYDTPKSMRKAMKDDLFQVTKNSSPGSFVLKKQCGCILKFASKKKPLVIECEENLQPVDCPCQKVTNWANNLIYLPYCKRNNGREKLNSEILNKDKLNEMALYATVDISRKTNRQSSGNDQDTSNKLLCTNYQNFEPKDEKVLEGPYANYENLEFALSLEFYENAKGLLKKAGVTQSELDALSANIDTVTTLATNVCKKCGHSKHSIQSQPQNKQKSDEYLLMEPPQDVKHDVIDHKSAPNPGYTPMSPNPNWSHSLKYPTSKLQRVEIEKSLSIPSFSSRFNKFPNIENMSNIKEILQKRSSSVDSGRLLEDLKEFDSSIGSHATSSSLETLRNLTLENRLSSPCDHDRQCYDCCKSSDSDNKISEECSAKDVLHLRNKHMDNAAIKRSSSVPCKGGNRDSSSSNDSGVSSCSLKHGGGEFQDFEMPLTSGQSRNHYMAQRRTRGSPLGSIHSSLPRKSKSSDPLRDLSMQIHKSNVSAKSCSAEAEVPILPPKQFKGKMDTNSTSSGTSDMSDYIETLSLTSSHSSSDATNVIRIHRQPTSTLRPRSGKEYHNMDPIITSMYKNGKDLSNYTNVP